LGLFLFIDTTLLELSHSYIIDAVLVKPFHRM
jgi:hypothetical protein